MSDTKGRILMPDQLKETRLDEVYNAVARLYQFIIPGLDRSATNTYLVSEALKNLLIQKGVLTQEELDKEVEVIGAQLKEAYEKAMKDAEEQKPTGPRILTPEELNKMADV